MPANPQRSASHKLDVSERDGYLELVVHPETLEVMGKTDLVTLIAPVVRETGSTRLLVVCEVPEVHLSGGFEAYKLGESLGRALTDVRTAIVIPGRPIEPLEDFAAHVAEQHGADVHYFTELDGATRWLLDPRTSLPGSAARKRALARD